MVLIATSITDIVIRIVVDGATLKFNVSITQISRLIYLEENKRVCGNSAHMELKGSYTSLAISFIGNVNYSIAKSLRDFANCGLEWQYQCIPVVCIQLTVATKYYFYIRCAVVVGQQLADSLAASSSTVECDFCSIADSQRTIDELDIIVLSRKSSRGDFVSTLVTPFPCRKRGVYVM